MRIALVNSAVERLTLDVANQFARMGHDAIVVTHAENSSGTVLSYAYDGAWVRTVAAGDTDRLVKILREESCEIVHAMHATGVPQAFDAAERLGLPVVAHVVAVGIAKTLLARAAAAVSPWRSTIERYADEGLDTTRWHHIPWGTDYGALESRLDPPPGDEFVLGLPGTPVPPESEHVVAQALRLVPDRPIRLVEYAGNHAERPSIPEKLSAVLIDSISDENPMAALDAIASRVPLITSGSGGLQELVEDYRCGFTYAADDAEALATLLGELCANRALLDDVRQTLVLPPSLEEEAWTLEGVYTDCLVNARL